MNTETKITADDVRKAFQLIADFQTQNSETPPSEMGLGNGYFVAVDIQAIERGEDQTYFGPHSDESRETSGDGRPGFIMVAQMPTESLMDVSDCLIQSIGPDRLILRQLQKMRQAADAD